MTIPLVLVAAMAENHVIGHENRLIWRLKSDMRRFRALTMGTPMIMGRKTFDSIGKPLPGRATIVLTRDRSFHVDGVAVAHDLDQALELAQEMGAAMSAHSVTVAGGADVYEQAMPLADALRLTLVHANPDGDAHFPAIDHGIFVEKARKIHPSGPDDEFAFTFVDYLRRPRSIDR